MGCHRIRLQHSIQMDLNLNLSAPSGLNRIDFHRKRWNVHYLSDFHLILAFLLRRDLSGNLDLKFKYTLQILSRSMSSSESKKPILFINFAWSILFINFLKLKKLLPTALWRTFPHKNVQKISFEYFRVQYLTWLYNFFFIEQTRH